MMNVPAVHIRTGAVGTIQDKMDTRDGRPQIYFQGTWMNNVAGWLPAHAVRPLGHVTAVDVRNANHNTIGAVQLENGRAFDERAGRPAGPAVVDARAVTAHGWLVIDLEPYRLEIARPDGTRMTATYSTASNGVLDARVIRVGNDRQQIMRRGGQSMRDAFLEVAELMPAS